MNLDYRVMRQPKSRRPGGRRTVSLRTLAPKRYNWRHSQFTERQVEVLALLELPGAYVARLAISVFMFRLDWDGGSRELHRKTVEPLVSERLIADDGLGWTLTAKGRTLLAGLEVLP